MLRFVVSFIALSTILYWPSFSWAQGNAQALSEIRYQNYDAEYDFDLYARSTELKTKYYIIYLLWDGTTQEVGPISSYESASRQIFFNFEHNQMPDGTIDATIEAREMLDSFSKFGRYSTYWEALVMADQLEFFGLETEIRWFRTPTISQKRIRFLQTW